MDSLSRSRSSGSSVGTFSFVASSARAEEDAAEEERRLAGLRRGRAEVAAALELRRSFGYLDDGECDCAVWSAAATAVSPCASCVERATAAAAAEAEHDDGYDGDRCRRPSLDGLGRRTAASYEREFGDLPLNSDDTAGDDY